MKQLTQQDLHKHVDKSRMAELERYLLEMNRRGLDEHYGRPYVNNEEALNAKVMYFQALLLSPCDRRMMARDIMNVPWLSEEDKVCNSSLGYWYGPTYYLVYLTGITDLSRAHIDFDRVYEDQDYVESLRENIAFTRKQKHQIWTSTELHTSIQTEGRNYCRLKYKDPNRKADSLDIVEWMAYLKKQGWAKKVLEAKTLESAFHTYCEPKGIGPYFGGNSVMMISNSRQAAYSHEENFCAPGGGAINTLDYLFEGLKKAGHKLNHLRLLQFLTDQQEVLLPNLTVPVEFQNMQGHDGMLLKSDMKRYTANAFEVGCCQFSVYRKFLEQPELIKRRLDVKWDLTPFKLREQGATDADIDNSKLRLDLLEF
jgi:hypothetical protein